MINVYGRTLDICGEERFLGFSGDNLTEIRQFKITDPSLFGLTFKLDAETDGIKNIFDLTKTVCDGYILLTWHVTNIHTEKKGILNVQLRGFSDDLCVWRSGSDYFRVGESIYSGEDFTAFSPSEFEEMEQRITSVCNRTESLSNTAETAATAATAAEADAAAAKLGAENSAENAAASASSAQYWAKLAQQWASGSVTHYYKTSEEEIFAIPSPNQGDIAYLINGDTCSQYIYDTQDTDSDGVNPEWIFMGYFSPAAEVTWDLIENKPAFADVALSGSYDDLTDKPDFATRDYVDSLSIPVVTGTHNIITFDSGVYSLDFANIYVNDTVNYENSATLVNYETGLLFCSRQWLNNHYVINALFCNYNDIRKFHISCDTYTVAVCDITNFATADDITSAILDSWEVGV